MHAITRSTRRPEHRETHPPNALPQDEGGPHRRTIRDPVSGLCDHRLLDESWAREIGRAERRAETFGVAVIDVHGLEQLTVAHGARAADAALCESGYALNLALRSEDIACAVARTRFVLLIPGISAEVLRRRVTEVRGELAGVHAARPAITTSSGIAMYPRDGRSGGALLRAACDSLKRAGD